MAQQNAKSDLSARNQFRIVPTSNQPPAFARVIQDLDATQCRQGHVNDRNFVRAVFHRADKYYRDHGPQDNALRFLLSHGVLLVGRDDEAKKRLYFDAERAKVIAQHLELAVEPPAAAPPEERIAALLEQRRAKPVKASDAAPAPSRGPSRDVLPDAAPPPPRVEPLEPHLHLVPPPAPLAVDDPPRKPSVPPAPVSVARDRVLMLTAAEEEVWQSLFAVSTCVVGTNDHRVVIGEPERLHGQWGIVHSEPEVFGTILGRFLASRDLFGPILGVITGGRCTYQYQRPYEAYHVVRIAERPVMEVDALTAWAINHVQSGLLVPGVRSRNPFASWLANQVRIGHAPASRFAPITIFQKLRGFHPDYPGQHWGVMMADPDTGSGFLVGVQGFGRYEYRLEAQGQPERKAPQAPMPRLVAELSPVAEAVPVERASVPAVEPPPAAEPLPEPPAPPPPAPRTFADELAELERKTAESDEAVRESERALQEALANFETAKAARKAAKADLEAAKARKP